MEMIYFLSMTTDNTLCVLQRIASVFSRHRINIEQMSIFETKRKGISHFSIVIHCEQDKIDKVMKQLRRIIEVIDIQISNQLSLSIEDDHEQKIA
jgi:acetolactate synthase I/III small subunit